jgi:predicted dehydrogenase
MKTISRDDVFKRYIEKIGISKRQADELGRVAYGFEDLAFIKAILEDRDPTPGLDVAVSAHKIIDAIYESSRKKSPIYFEEKGE